MRPRSTTITILSLAMAFVCWLGLGYLVHYHPPDTIGRVLFLCLLFLACLPCTSAWPPASKRRRGGR